MTISYTLDVSQTSFRSFMKLLFRWRGSVWKAVLSQLFCWTILFLVISVLYRYCMAEQQQKMFESLIRYLDDKLDSTIPLTFMLGFFVSFVVGRWGSILNGIGWIDDVAILIASYIRGADEETRLLRRNLVRYLVLSQALVLRDISMQVRKRFPTLETLAASGLMTEEEEILLSDIHDPYSRYWAPIQWAVNAVYDCKRNGKIEDSYLLSKIVDELGKFRHGLAALLKYDWVPVPLVYPQVIFLSVRIYFAICLIGRQFIVEHTENAISATSISNLWFPLTTMVQFIVYMGWMKVAEALLNPLGEDDDDLECNYIIDKNLITGTQLVELWWPVGKSDSSNEATQTGYSVVEEGLARIPAFRRDEYNGSDKIAPLYSLESADRTVHPLEGSASKINLVKGRKELIMTPHKNKLSELKATDQCLYLRKVSVNAHNVRHEKQREEERKNSPDTCLQRVRGRSKSDYVQYYDKSPSMSFVVPRMKSGTFTPASFTNHAQNNWNNTDVEQPEDNGRPPVFGNNSVAPQSIPPRANSLQLPSITSTATVNLDNSSHGVRRC